MLNKHILSTIKKNINIVLYHEYDSELYAFSYYYKTSRF
jgi:hypothetical protein